MLAPPSPDDLISLLPTQAHTVLSVQPPTDTSRLPAAEQAAAESMQPVRRREFMHGRICARAALTALGVADPVIPVGADREPVWPDGVVGSISHCDAVAAAVVARREDIGGLGIDLESNEPLDRQTLALVCRETELSWLAHADDELHLAKLIFSAKESIYKCIWPVIRHFVDFQDIGIQIDTETQRFVAVDWDDDLPAPLIGSIRGRYRVRDGWIMTTSCLSPIRIDP